MAEGLNGKKALVTGGTGYVASRLIPELIRAGATVRVTSRSAGSASFPFEDIEQVDSDLADSGSLKGALEGIEVAYYLVHSMASQDFQERDRVAARNFLAAAQEAGVERIVYLSGLGAAGDRLSKHLLSRHEVGSILASGSIPVTEMRCAIVIGSGSVAFDMLRYLTERLPAMIAPRWLETKIQPLSEDDLVRYLVAAGAESEPGGIVEIGGADVLSYREMIGLYAAHRGLRRVVISVPLLTPRLSSYWVRLMTPVATSVSRPLIDGLRNEVIVTDDKAAARYPDIRPLNFVEALQVALDRQRSTLALELSTGTPIPGTRVALLTDERSEHVSGSPEEAVDVLSTFGTDISWYPIPLAWKIRAWIDKPSLPREKTADAWAKDRWWSVAATEVENAVLLSVKLRAPGEAMLALRAEPAEIGSTFIQTAAFLPRGLLGRAYWWILWPFHRPIFTLMAKRTARRIDAA